MTEWISKEMRKLADPDVHRSAGDWMQMMRAGLRQAADEIDALRYERDVYQHKHRLANEGWGEAVKQLDIAVTSLRDFSWEGSSVNFKARATLKAIEDAGSRESLERVTLVASIVELAERFEQLVQRHYLSKEPEYDLFYFDATHVALKQSIAAYRSATSQARSEGEGG